MFCGLSDYRSACLVPPHSMQDKWNTTLADGTTLTADQVRSNIERLRQPFLLPVTHQTVSGVTAAAGPRHMTCYDASPHLCPSLGLWSYRE
jgi:hypothetical protein